MPRPAHTQTLQLVRPPGPVKHEPQLIDVTLRASDRMLLTVEEAADRLCIGRTLMYELIRDGAINTITVGRLRRIEPEALTEFISNRKSG